MSGGKKPSTDANTALAGVLTVLQTPYHDDETIDYDTLAREVDWVFSRGASGVVIAMVSEVLRLASDEREQLTAVVCDAVASRGAVVVSVGAESTVVAERYARHAEACGATAVMAIPPVATRALESELRKYYDRLLNAVSIPVIVQDASAYVGAAMNVEFQARLMVDHGPDRVCFKPEAHPIGPRLTALRETTGGKARVFEGSGGLALVDSFRRGVTGTMPGADLVDANVGLWRALVAGDEERADRISAPLIALVSLQSSLDAFLAVEKYLLAKQGVFRNQVVRGPVGFEIDPGTREHIDRLFERLQNALA